MLGWRSSSAPIHFPLEQNLSIVVATFAAIPIAVVAARELTRSRLADYDGRRAKEELLRAHDDFVAMLTHDIRNPLAVIQGYAEVLREEPDMAADERDQMLASIERASGTALALAANFLDASKIEAGHFSLKKGPTSVADVLRQAVADQRPLAEQKGVRLTDECIGELPVITADPGARFRMTLPLG